MEAESGRLPRVLDLQRSAAASLAAGEAQRAYVTYFEALRVLGDTYSSPAQIDDTNIKQLAAEDRFEQGLAPEAAAQLARVLDERVAMLQAKTPSTAPPVGAPAASPPTAASHARFCVNCGASRKNDDAFCVQCGVRFLV